MRMDLPREACRASLGEGLSASRDALTTRQESAEGIVGMRSRSTRPRHSPERGETVGVAGPGTACRRPERSLDRGVNGRRVGGAIHGRWAAENPV